MDTFELPEETMINSPYGVARLSDKFCVCGQYGSLLVHCCFAMRVSTLAPKPIEVVFSRNVTIKQNKNIIFATIFNNNHVTVKLK